MRMFRTLMLILALMGLTAAPALAAKGEVELAYVEWSSEVASTNVVKAALEDLGYEVEITPVTVGAMYQAVATGDVDGMVAAWLPTLQKSYLDAVKDKVVDLGPNLEGTKSGLVVPAYVEIDSIDQMNDVADKFDDEIIGIDPGAGIMGTTETVIKDYGLDKFELVDSAGAMMTATLADKIRRNEWVVVTGWTPHWMFAKWDLKYLKDPKNLYGGAENISTIVRKGLKEDKPEVYKLLDNFSWTPDDMAEVMIWVQDGMEPAEAARKWIDENKETVASWSK